MSTMTTRTYAQRLQTFDGLWATQKTAARQLAAIGHVAERPPLEVLDEGSRCISCSAFVAMERSLKALGDDTGAIFSGEDFDSFSFHHASCTRLQIRMPLDPEVLLRGLHGDRIEDIRRKWQRRCGSSSVAEGVQRQLQTSSLFSLPTEIRLEIYALVLPNLDPVTQIVPLNRDSARVVTQVGYDKTGPRNTTKPNILRTCHTVYKEALDLIYTNTIFKFASSKVLYLFLREIGKHGRDLLRSVDLYCGYREDAIAFALLASCDNLRSITIRLPRPMILFPRAPIWCIDGMSCLLALSGLEDVRFDVCSPGLIHMDDSKPDSAIIRRELTRPRGTAGDIRSVDGYLDI